MAVAFRILESEHLHFKKQAQSGLIRLGGDDVPEISKQLFPVGGPMIRGQSLKCCLQAGLHMLHDLGDERLLRSEVMEQHARARPDVRRQGPQRKICQAVPEEISEALLQELMTSLYVTTVTQRGLASIWHWPEKEVNKGG